MTTLQRTHEISQHRFDFDPVEAIIKPPHDEALRSRLRCHLSVLKRYRREGLRWTTADRIAVKVLGRHPAEVWPDWYEVVS